MNSWLGPSNGVFLCCFSGLFSLLFWSLGFLESHVSEDGIPGGVFFRKSLARRWEENIVTPLEI